MSRKPNEFSLQDKICVLVTHQLQYLHDIEHIVIMNAGQIKAQGSYEYIKSNENDFSTFYDFEKSTDANESETLSDENNYNEKVSKFN